VALLQLTAPVFRLPSLGEGLSRVASRGDWLAESLCETTDAGADGEVLGRAAHLGLASWIPVTQGGLHPILAAPCCPVLLGFSRPDCRLARSRNPRRALERYTLGANIAAARIAAIYAELFPAKIAGGPPEVWPSGGLLSGAFALQSAAITAGPQRAFRLRPAIRAIDSPRTDHPRSIRLPPTTIR